MLKRKFYLAASAAVLLGCAPTTWIKPGASQQDYATDSYQCEKDARQSGYFGGGLVGAANMVEFAQRCMVAHGWRKLDPAAAAERAPRMARAKRAIEESKACINGVRAREDFLVLAPRFGDPTTGKHTPAQLASTDRPSAAEAQTFSIYFAAIETCRAQLRAVVSVTFPEVVQPLRELSAEQGAISAKIAARQITWGQALMAIEASGDSATNKLRAIQI